MQARGWNPIEQVFAKHKHGMRKAAERTKTAIWKRIGTLLDALTPYKCAKYLVNSDSGETFCPATA